MVHIRLTYPYSPFSRLSNIIFFILSLAVVSSLAQPAPLTFTDCSSGVNLPPSQKINITSVYGQLGTDDNGQDQYLNLTIFGDTGREIVPISNVTGLLATLFTTSTILTFEVYDNSSFVCSTLRPPSPLPEINPTTFYCPIAPGPIAFSSSIPLAKSTPDIFTISTQLRIVDTSEPAIELCCIDVGATPLDLSGKGRPDNVYGHAIIIFWTSVALTIVYWIVTGLGRVSAAWSRTGVKAGDGLWSHFQRAGFILASAISGESLSSTPALMRFCTPSMRDIIFHTQWCAILSMIAVQWPLFAYPYFVQTAWATLSYNVTLTQGSHVSGARYNPLNAPTFNPPTAFVDQVANPSSPIFINETLYNRLLVLPPNTPSGLATFAYVLGLRPQDMFGICLSLFLCIIAGAVVISILVWLVDSAISSLLGKTSTDFASGGGSSPLVLTSKEGTMASVDDRSAAKSSIRIMLRRTSLPAPAILRNGRWKRLIRPSSFHGSVLLGNIVRIVILFHLPVTVFSCYQFTTGRPQSTVVSIVLAVLCFFSFSLAIPSWLIFRLIKSPTNKLYDETKTLLMLGPLYNNYNHGSQLFAALFFATSLVYGIVVGCGQESGTAQAIIILVFEVASALATSIWLPWGRGASMGVLSFFFCVARIIIAVLLVILTPVVSVGEQAGSWIAAAVLFILGLIYTIFILILFSKIVEALIRIFGKVPFNQSRHHIDSGLLGVLGLLGCCGRRGRRVQSKQANTSENTNHETNNLNAQFSSLSSAKQSTPRSSTVGPPSVLRPEHALRPYREDSDDESGYIMGAWQPFPRSGYNIVDDQVRTETEPPLPPKSGFSRVGGGRARYDSPYAIVPKQNQPVSSAEHIRSPLTRDSPSTMSDNTANESVISVNHQVTSTQLPEASSMVTAPAHVRTQSQTAIIEDASALHARHLASSPAEDSQRTNSLLPLDQSAVGKGNEDKEGTFPRRKLWFNLRRNRRMSEGNYDAQPEGLEDEAPTGGRSFVVVRERRPNVPTAESLFSAADNVNIDNESPLVQNQNPSNSSAVTPAPEIPRRSSRRLSHI